MSIHFLMPQDCLEPKQIDRHFLLQAESLVERGHIASILEDEVFAGTKSLKKSFQDATVVYRGWMVKPTDYERFEKQMASKGGKLLTNGTQYRLTHWMPNWYPMLKEFTPETVFIDQAASLRGELEKLSWEAFFLKDYVKSLKVDGGSIVMHPEDGERWFKEMLLYRDEIEGGIAIRRVESFVPDSEIRYFVLNSVAYGADRQPVPELVSVAAARIDSPFFSVDIARNTDGEIRIVELGDGQVSDLVGWTPERFAEIWDDFSVG